MLYTDEELRELGVQFGENVRIDRTAALFNPSRIRIGSRVRIDCHVIISAEEMVTIGNNVHIAAATHLFGRAGISLADFTNLSSRVSLFTTSDDYSGGFLTNPTVPDRYTNVALEPIVLGRHAIVGCGSVILPGVTLGDGAAVGALSLVKTDVPPNNIVAGCPARTIGVRNAERLAELEARYLEELDREGGS